MTILKKHEKIVLIQHYEKRVLLSTKLLIKYSSLRDFKKSETYKNYKNYYIDNILKIKRNEH